MPRHQLRRDCPICHRDVAVNRDGTFRAHACVPASSPEEADFRHYEYRRGFVAGLRLGRAEALKEKTSHA